MCLPGGVGQKGVCVMCVHRSLLPMETQSSVHFSFESLSFCLVLKAKSLRWWNAKLEGF